MTHCKIVIRSTIDLINYLYKEINDICGIRKADFYKSLENNELKLNNMEVDNDKVIAAFRLAKTDETKKVLVDLFGKSINKPNLDDYRTIKTYEDACKVLNIEPLFFDNDPFIGELDEDCEDYGLKKADLPAHIIALIKLETIARALWGKNFEPKPDAKGTAIYYYPWFVLYTKKEIENMDDDDKGALLSAFAVNSAYAGFGCLSAFAVNGAHAHAYIGFRLCQETEEKALYFGKQFVELWADYLAFNFTVWERIKK